MIGIDTNILVRFFIQDDPRQTAIATRVLSSHCTEENPGWINRVVLCELVWVLETAYQCTRTEIATTLRVLMQTAEVKVENPDLTWQALRAYEHSKADFADTLILATNQSSGCEYTMTLDRAAAKLPGGKLAR
jgi:predicted nucleic-acid-binding protein